jgi:hypothetical protein
MTLVGGLRCKMTGSFACYCSATSPGCFRGSLSAVPLNAALNSLSVVTMVTLAHVLGFVAQLRLRPRFGKGAQPPPAHA